MAEHNEYLTFTEYLNQNLPNIQEYYDKVTSLRCETSKLLLQISTVFNPEVLIELNSVYESGLKCDQFIMEGQQLKLEMDLELKNVEGTSANKYKEIMEEIGLIIDPSINLNNINP